MKIYAQNLLHRLERFSIQLDKVELFVNKPWVLIDQDNNYQKYIFKRDGELVMSLNGKVQVGKWEFIGAANSLLIDRIVDKLLLNQLYTDEGVMALKCDGFNNDYFILANETIIPDLNIENYLRKIEHKKFNVISGRLITGGTLEIFLENNEEPKIGMRATLEGEEIEYDLVRTKKTNTLYEIKQSRIIRISYPKVYYLNELNTIRIERQNITEISKGDYAYLNNKPIPDGKFKIGFMRYIKTINGVIQKTSSF
ncbi:hypothetical protein [Salegentibacter sp. T436]|uniref:hypothetical protein n=1 Tax=Salegentibacter sp. T436 TaxID=1729720 RepID=UPI00094A79E0|nr:hypothetical protein [Salegentibacter sp. T436]APS40631.1 hypothetical protein AO058_17885 [Salegentibacter sp. T436]